jgi:hypothetical protein
MRTSVNSNHYGGNGVLLRLKDVIDDYPDKLLRLNLMQIRGGKLRIQRRLESRTAESGCVNATTKAFRTQVYIFLGDVSCQPIKTPQTRTKS